MIYPDNRRALKIEYTIIQLNLDTQSLGNYLRKDCRNAIAHIRRDNAADNKRILISTKIVQELARYFIRNNLKVAESLYLVRCKGITHPIYADDTLIRTHSCGMAYE